MISPSGVRQVGCVGAGVVGGGWAVHFLAKGFDVVCYDPKAGFEARLTAFVEHAWPYVEKLGLAPGASPDRLSCVARLAHAVETVDFVQENAPERLELKRSLLAEIDALAREEIVISSSTSGLLPSELQADCARPQRVAVGHPFNPPFLMPLVEVVGGKATAPETMVWLADFYRSTGKHVITLPRELPGFVANRLQEAVWREAVQLMNAGDATPDDIDAAIAQGPGLRWAFMGPILQMELTGGSGGTRHSIEQFSPEIKKNWCHAPSPDLSDELRGRLIESATRRMVGRTNAELAAERDSWLTAALAFRQRVSGE
jgi:carnitine 3-dehydrogenase